MGPAAPFLADWSVCGLSALSLGFVTDVNETVEGWDARQLPHLSVL